MSIKTGEKENLFTDIVKEKVIDVKPVTFSELEIISKEKQYSVCKIEKNDKSCATGFLCIIPFNSKLKPLAVLITCNHVLSNEDIEYGKEINLIINDNIKKKLYIDESRKVYTSNEKHYDITMIEINEEDGFNINNLLEIDYDIYNEGSLNDRFRNESVYLIHYPEGKNSSFSVNVIQNIDSNNIKIRHLCSTDYGSSGAPIIDLKSFKVIGVHIGKHKTNDYNFGVILRNPIQEFYDKYNKLKKGKSMVSVVSKKEEKVKPIEYYDHTKNEISLTIKVDENDINKKFIFWIIQTILVGLRSKNIITII